MLFLLALRLDIRDEDSWDILDTGFVRHEPTDRAFHRKPIAIPFLFCSHGHMERLDPSELSCAILSAPGWARVGITMSDERMREKAAAELAQSIIEQLSGHRDPDPNQLPLFP